MKHVKVFGAAAIILGLSSLALKDSYFFADPINVDVERQPGDPMDGYWTTEKEEGCFDSGLVYSISDDGISDVIDGVVVKREDMFFDRDATGRFIHAKPKPSFTYKYYFEDNGNELTQTKLMSIEGSRTLSAEQRTPFFIRCDRPTAKAKFLSLFFKVFDPSSLSQE